MKKGRLKRLLIFSFVSILSITSLVGSSVFADEQDKEYVKITEKSARWTDIDHYLADVLIKVKGSQVVEPVDVVICLDKSGSMDMDFLMNNKPQASCPCLNQEHFYLDKKKIDGAEVPAAFEGAESSKDTLICDKENNTLTVFDPDTNKWTVLDTSNEIHRYYMFSAVDIYPYHFKKDAAGNYIRISKWKTDTAVPYWDHADEARGCYDRWMEAKSAVKAFSKSVIDTNSKNRVALVPFSERDVNKDFCVNWTKDTDLLNAKIDSLATTTSTDYIYGLSMAYNLLNNRTEEDKAAKKAIVVFISDGVPDPQGATLSRNGKIVAFYNAPAHISELANAIKGDENWTPNPGLATSFWGARSGAYQRHDVDAVDVMGMGATIISVALMIENNQTAILQGMASGSEFFYDFNINDASGSSGVLTDHLLNMTLLPAGRETVLSDKISQYFTVDEENLSEGLQCITDAFTGEQTIKYNIGQIYDQELSITIPLILKEEYRGEQDLTYYPTNEDGDKPGAKVDYIDCFDKDRTDYHLTPELPYILELVTPGGQETATPAGQETATPTGQETATPTGQETATPTGRETVTPQRHPIPTPGVTNTNNGGNNIYPDKNPETGMENKGAILIWVMTVSFCAMIIMINRNRKGYKVR